jgi:ABC-type multidrug transport system fused ATPase/permease subunit
MRYLIALTLKHRALLLLALVALGVGSGINLLLPAVLREFINGSPEFYFRDHAAQTAFILIGLFALQCLGFYYRSLLFNILGQRVVNSLRSNLFSTLIQKPIAFFDSNRSGDLVSRLSADTLLIQDAISIKLSVFVRYTFQVIVGIAMMLSISVKLTATILLILPPLIFSSVVLGKKLKQLSKEQQGALGATSSIAEEALGGARVIRAFNQEPRFIERYSHAVHALLAVAIRRASVASFFSSFVSFLMNSSIVAVLIYGISLVFNGGLSAGDLTAFMLYGMIVAVSFAFVSSGYTEFVNAVGAGERVFDLLEAEKQVAPSSNSAERFQIKQSLDFNNVSFCYPSRSEVTVLESVTLTIEAGKTTALVGPSGSGKSTIVGLLLGFYPASSGSLSIDGSTLRAEDFISLRNSVALVPQEPQLFALSIAENLRLGKNTATDEQLRAACAQARILEFIDGLPKGFETEVGERGVLLSAGQKQRLAIARALLKEPELLILDEATSALDSENEHLVQEALETIMKERTVLVIAHRLSTVKTAHRLYVLEEGTVRESGTHSELIKRKGLYHQLVERQELGLGH